MRPIIGITSTGKNEAYLESHYYNSYYASPSQYADAVRRAGGIPVVVPPIRPDEVEFILPRIDGIIISGGADVSPEIYGGDSQHSNLTQLDRDRDISEIAMLRNLIEIGEKPIFCICRGMQVLNVALGGTLYEHIPDIIEEDMHRDQGSWAVHEVNIERNSLLAQVMQVTTVGTYSGHHQAVKGIGEGLSIVATAADGIIEAVTHASHPWLIGVQWHPEKSAEEDVTQQRLFDALVEAARKRIKV